MTSPRWMYTHIYIYIHIHMFLFLEFVVSITALTVGIYVSYDSNAVSPLASPHRGAVPPRRPPHRGCVEARPGGAAWGTWGWSRGRRGRGTGWQNGLWGLRRGFQVLEGPCTGVSLPRDPAAIGGEVDVNTRRSTTKNSCSHLIYKLLRSDQQVDDFNYCHHVLRPGAK